MTKVSTTTPLCFTNMNLEAVRQRYRPRKVRLLLVGESPPASGKFFYLKSAMTTYTARAFEKAQGSEFSSTEEFLTHFKDCGCYLEDLSHSPVDHLQPKERNERLREEIDHLAERIKALNPSTVVIVLKRIEGYVREALQRSGCPATVYVLPFPGNAHQRKYISKLADVIREHVKLNTTKS